MKLIEELEDSVLRVNNMSILPIIMMQQTMMQQHLLNNSLTNNNANQSTSKKQKEEKKEEKYVPKHVKKEDLEKEQVSF